MRQIFRVIAGSSFGQEFLPDGDRVVCGSDKACDWHLANDVLIAPRHFELHMAAGQWQLIPLAQRMLSVNGLPPTGKTALNLGDQIQVGMTVLSVSTHLEASGGNTQQSGDTQGADFQETRHGDSRKLTNKVLEKLRAATQPLYAIVDAARSPTILPLLEAAEDRFQCLYSGESAKELKDFAPYLVQFQNNSKLLEELVEQWQADAWGIFLTSDLPFEKVRLHFKKFLMVTGPNGEELYFRFYDPRVLGIFLPIATEDQLTSLHQWEGKFIFI